MLTRFSSCFFISAIFVSINVAVGRNRTKSDGWESKGKGKGSEVEQPNLCPICADGADPIPPDDLIFSKSGKGSKYMNSLLSDEQIGTLLFNTNFVQFLSPGSQKLDLCANIELSCASLADLMSQFTETQIEKGICTGFQELAFRLGCGCETRPEVPCDFCGLFGGGAPILLNEDG